MGDAESVEVAHSSHNIEQHLVRPATPLEFLMRAWVVKPNELPESCAARLHRYVEVGHLQVLAVPYAAHPHNVRMRKGLKHVVGSSFFGSLLCFYSLPLDEHLLVLESINAQENIAEAALADCTATVFSNTLKAFIHA